MLHGILDVRGLPSGAEERGLYGISRNSGLDLRSDIFNELILNHSE